MQQKREYFGLTLPQIAILAGLAGAACLVFGLAGWFLLRGNLRPFTRMPPTTLVPQAAATFMVAPTSTPTATPTAVPYEMLIPAGWKQFKTDLVEIWLPADFKSGTSKISNDLQNTAVPALVMTGVTSKSSLYQILVMVSYEPLTAGSLDTFLDTSLAKFPTEVRVTERRKVSVNGIEAVRFVFETRDNNVDIDVLAYVFLDGSTVWYVEYGAQINEFYDRLPTFENSVKTFRIVR